MCNPASNYWPGKETRRGENVRLTGADGKSFEVHISKPEGNPPFATVLIIHDYFDPEHYYYDLADQYAAAGYLGVCPNLYERQGKLREQTHDEAGKRIGNVSDTQVFDDVDATLDHLQKEGLLGDLVITGFCWGGRIAFRLAARHPEAKLLMPFYGILAAAPGKDAVNPFDEADQISCRVLGFYGAADGSIPVDLVKQMEEVLRQKGVNAELRLYEGAPHCFFRTPEFKEYSDDVWRRALGALKETVS
jgi:carboxymethylenebutenolidase